MRSSFALKLVAERQASRVTVTGQAFGHIAHDPPPSRHNVTDAVQEKKCGKADPEAQSVCPLGVYAHAQQLIFGHVVENKGKIRIAGVFR